MAIDKVVIYQNTSVLHDEILAHRFGLLPVLADPELFDFKEENEAFNENNAIKFYINIKCVRKIDYAKDEDLSGIPMPQFLDNHLVLASHISWEPIGNQATKFKGKPIKILHDNILVAKLAENQEIEAEMYCTKNIGKVHTKWSPVSTAYYRLFPIVTIVSPVVGEDAEEIKNLCPSKVFDIEDLKSKKQPKLFVAKETNCTDCRACVNHATLGSHFELGKKVNNYHFTIESVGVLEPASIFLRALQILGEKASYYQNFL